MSLFDALKGANLLTQQQVEEKEQAEKDKESTVRGQIFQLSKKSCRTQLNCANDPAEFRNAAKEFLLSEPTAINIVIKEVHRFKGSAEGKKLIWEIYQLRDALKETPNEDNQKIVIERALRRIDRKFEPIK